jgi:hypothetical protein
MGWYRNRPGPVPIADVNKSATNQATQPLSKKWGAAMPVMVTKEKPPEGGSEFKPDDRESSSHQCWL